ncbi:DUF5343 domain-containing protein [Stenotrophobium rhamnosiphilum]|uniref:DUF5343 domain-containing protein n=1 Tax=Stenotrophobium rhamnosiphilum TaxID=2029166 RepID=A0A2T5MBL5_9GAMM|nr:DUF5343 domain-containing protein [Stenotrophobium rhamnosiphilum]PTU29134.1 hypothetical protein CJD38_17450 [Stenotrophobium rhamnosiphilum]
MPSALPYVPNYGKIKVLFEKIASAKVPDSFTQAYLAETLGLKSGGDRPLIPLLKALGLVDQSGKPTADYALLKNSQRAGQTLALGIGRAFAPLFAANESAHKATGDELKGLIAQVAGSDEEVTRRTAGTFRTLVEVAGVNSFDDAKPEHKDHEEIVGDKSGEREKIDSQKNDKRSGIRPEFHYNIQVHLPSNATEETYLNIFNALRKSLS